MKNLKRTLLITVALIALFSTQSFSQSLKLGIEGGINLANVSVTPDFPTTSRTGMMVGGFAEIGVSPTIAIKPGLRYVSKGFSGTFNGFPYTDKLNYLEIPALLKIKFPLAQVRPYLEAGPTISFMLSASEEFNNGNQQAQDIDVSQFYESTDFGLYFGGGLDFSIGAKTEMFTGFGYGLGLSNIAKSPNVTGKNTGFRVSAGVKFGL